ncbi:hypothetical protein EVG20_g5600 [Dentipellis fragilis]|uniref:Uncharacterized protein n=1 Tax=Dentipellis fragilis TaxID=205917 RepID=A0A4Y9YUP6_9AGAM|nr:hypothetical protein EVG20_g5600 [Dentipellis fragilis]
MDLTVPYRYGALIRNPRRRMRCAFWTLSAGTPTLPDADPRTTRAAGRASSSFPDQAASSATRRSRLIFFSAGTSTGKLYVLGGGDRKVLHYLPGAHTLIYNSRSQLPETVESQLQAILADLDLQQLRALKTEGVPLGGVVRVLSGRYVSTLRKFVLDAVPWNSLKEREKELEVVKGLATFVKVNFARRQTRRSFDWS